jgi:hypothetical protein
VNGATTPLARYFSAAVAESGGCGSKPAAVATAQISLRRFIFSWVESESERIAFEFGRHVLAACAVDSRTRQERNAKQTFNGKRLVRCDVRVDASRSRRIRDSPAKIDPVL